MKHAVLVLFLALTNVSGTSESAQSKCFIKNMRRSAKTVMHHTALLKVPGWIT